MDRIQNLQERVSKIEERNLRVEADKAWGGFPFKKAANCFFYLPYYSFLPKVYYKNRSVD